MSTRQTTTVSGGAAPAGLVNAASWRTGATALATGTAADASDAVVRVVDNNPVVGTTGYTGTSKYAPISQYPASYDYTTKVSDYGTPNAYYANGAGAPTEGIYSAINKADGDFQQGMLGQRNWGRLVARANAGNTDQATVGGAQAWDLMPSGWNQYNGLTYTRTPTGAVDANGRPLYTYTAVQGAPGQVLPGAHENNQFAYGQPLVESLMTEGSFVKDITSVSDMIKKWNYVMFRAKNGAGYGQYMPDDRTTIGVVFFWIGFGVLSGLGLVFLFLTLRRDETKRRFHYITVCYSWIAAVAYYCMARGQGSVALFDTLATNSNYSPFRVFYFARYIDWTFSTPLILLDLALLAGTSIATAAMLCFADIMMIVTGLLGALSMSGTKWGWFAFSCCGFIAILISLVTTLRKAAREKSPEVEKTYNILVLLVFLTWPIYPIIWIIGQGTKSIHIDAEIIVFSVTDCCAKGLFGLVLLLSTNAIEDATFKDSKRMALPPTYTSSTIYQGVLESKA